jgi:hypothetical protein
VLDDLKTWLQTNSTRVPKDSLTAKAIQYTLNQWELLIGYCDDGRLHISNALAENAIRPFAVGRRYPRSEVMEDFRRQGLRRRSFCSLVSGYLH